MILAFSSSSSVDQSSFLKLQDSFSDVTLVQALPEHGVTTVFVNLSNTKLELLHPLGEKSPIAGFLEKNKAGGIHHICIEVRPSAKTITMEEIDVISTPKTWIWNSCANIV